jgi:hypothetical protein
MSMHPQDQDLDHAHNHVHQDSESAQSDHPALHPSQFLSKQSRRAFLTSLGAAAALGTNTAIGFLRDPEIAQAETLAAADPLRDASNIHVLKATPETCFWGFFNKDLPPVMTINSGDIVYIEALTHHAGDAPDLLMDAGVREVYNKITDRGPGVHIMTGPIAVRGAEVGDTLMVRILKTEPRLPYGSNLAAHWGYLYDSFKKERVTIYKIDAEANLAQPAFAFDFKGRPIYDQPGFISTPDPSTRETIKTGIALPLRPH